MVEIRGRRRTSFWWHDSHNDGNSRRGQHTIGDVLQCDGGGEWRAYYVRFIATYLFTCFTCILCVLSASTSAQALDFGSLSSPINNTSNKQILLHQANLNCKWSSPTCVLQFPMATCDCNMKRIRQPNTNTTPHTQTNFGDKSKDTF